jgi:hypothetical protein
MMAVGDQGTIITFDGSKWTLVPSGITTPFYGVANSSGQVIVGAGGNIFRKALAGPSWVADVSNTTNDLYAVSGGVLLPGDNASAVGAGGTVRMWNSANGQWVPTPHFSTVDILYGVWDNPSVGTWVVGTSGKVNRRGGGNTWCQTAGCSTSGTTNTLYAVAGIVGSSYPVWAVGGAGTIIRYDGTAWSSAVSGTTHTLRALAVGGASDVWTAGDYGTVLHWDGSSWSGVPTGITMNLYAIVVASPYVYVFGQSGTILFRRP